MRDTFDYHQANPKVSLDTHVKNRTVALGSALYSKIPIYLDTNFWVNLQKAAFKDNAPEDHIKLLQLLRTAAANGQIFCPVTESIFLELLKQSDLKSRLETAALMEELSLGVTMLEPQARAATELEHFVHSIVRDKNDLYPLSYLVWHKVTYVLGLTHPNLTQFNKETQLVIQKAFFDEMWNISLVNMVELITKLPRSC